LGRDVRTAIANVRIGCIIWYAPHRHWFLHTAAVLQATFDALLAEKAPGLTATHIIEPGLVVEELWRASFQPAWTDENTLIIGTFRWGDRLNP
jgi:hypothetical protein